MCLLESDIETENSQYSLLHSQKAKIFVTQKPIRVATRRLFSRKCASFHWKLCAVYSAAKRPRGNNRNWATTRLDSNNAVPREIFLVSVFEALCQLQLN